MADDLEGYGPRPGQSDIERLLEDARTLSPVGIERVANGWTTAIAGEGIEQWHHAEAAAIQTLEASDRAPDWEDLRRSIVRMTEGEHALLPWQQEHGETGHKAERALLGAALAL